MSTCRLNWARIDQGFVYIFRSSTIISMHDGSEATLRDVMELYNRGGNKNPYLDPKMTPLNLTPAEIDAVVEFMKALEGEGFQDSAPKSFPR